MVPDASTHRQTTSIRDGDVKDPVGGIWKRAFDFGVALAALVIMSPMILMITLLILVTMGRPIFSARRCVGFNKSAFHRLKFRTMALTAQEMRAHDFAEPEGKARPCRGAARRAFGEQNATWLGSILRKADLDELPQLFNVLRGDMSVVGPRPLLASELSQYGARAKDYAKARPGLTGLGQISGRDSTVAQRVKCDCYYVRCWSPALDVFILTRTLLAGLGSETRPDRRSQAFALRPDCRKRI
jgi:exopolysaccharide production protein ExoY